MSKTLDRLQAVVEAAKPGVDLLAAALARLGDWPSHDRIEPQRFRIAADLNAALLDAGYAVAPVEARNTYPEALAVVRAAYQYAEVHMDASPLEHPELDGCFAGLEAALAAFDEAATRSLP